MLKYLLITLLSFLAVWGQIGGSQSWWNRNCRTVTEGVAENTGEEPNLLRQFASSTPKDEIQVDELLIDAVRIFHNDARGGFKAALLRFHYKVLSSDHFKNTFVLNQNAITGPIFFCQFDTWSGMIYMVRKLIEYDDFCVNFENSNRKSKDIKFKTDLENLFKDKIGFLDGNGLPTLRARVNTKTKTAFSAIVKKVPKTMINPAVVSLIYHLGLQDIGPKLFTCQYTDDNVLLAYDNIDDTLASKKGQEYLKKTLPSVRHMIGLAVLELLEALHKTNYTHDNLSLSSIVVTKGNEIKLWELEKVVRNGEQRPYSTASSLNKIKRFWPQKASISHDFQLFVSLYLELMTQKQNPLFYYRNEGGFKKMPINCFDQRDNPECISDFRDIVREYLEKTYADPEVNAECKFPNKPSATLFDMFNSQEESNSKKLVNELKEISSECIRKEKE